MRAVTLRQLGTQLMVRGPKNIETRSRAAHRKLIGQRAGDPHAMPTDTVVWREQRQLQESEAAKIITVVNHTSSHR